jgi:hypothetical protein
VAFSCPSIFDLRYWRKASRETADRGRIRVLAGQEGCLAGQYRLAYPDLVGVISLLSCSLKLSPTARSTLTDYSSEVFHSFRIWRELSIRDG